MKKYLACFLIALALFLFPGCSLLDVTQELPQDSNEQPEETPVPTPAPRKGGELAVPLTAPDTFNPLLTQSRDMLNFLSLLFESPIAYDENSKPIPSLVSSWEVSPDGRLWVFHVRKGVKWHNGQELTGDDILFTFQALQSGTLGSFYQKNIAGNANILETGLRNGDPYTFFVRLAEPTYQILDTLTFPVLPRSVYQSAEYMTNRKTDTSMIPVGTGPYRVDPAHPYDGASLRLVRNDSWWNGTPYIDSILAKTYATNEEVRNAFNKREVHLVDTMVVYANTNTNLNNATHYKYLTQSYEFLALNNESPLFADKSIRKAIAYAIDRKDIISKVYLNNAETVDVPIPSNSWLYDSTYRIYDYDPDRARKILTDAGWADSDGDGVLDKTTDGRKTDLSFTILTNNDNDFRRDTVSLIAEHLALVGFKVQTELVGWDQLQNERMLNHQFDAVLTGYYLDYVHDLRFALHSNQIGTGLNNFIRYRSPELDSLLDTAAKAYTEDERKAVYQKIQQHITEELPLISLYFRTGSLLVDNRVHGIGKIGELSLYRDIKDWYLAE
jgi:peptide/nickel transport system substrate-binding protein